ncbi:S8 family serine peptidase [uncultured Streptomyces sp.]|uniref:S8 family serine peptidase n=1 Tax=uncultured Streptomyces sp. TaxID=174707 RepID=UPI002609960A|nr:S8 family serine peptidase [uncultured Streptomyces sp.]
MTAGTSPLRTRHRPRAARRPVAALTIALACGLGLAGPAPSAVADTRSEQWYLKAMQMEDIWKTARGEGVTVAVIDTGVNPDTPSLRGQVLKGLDATGADGDENDDYDGHGTSMAELIAGTGKSGGLQGVAPAAKILPMRVGTAEFQKAHSSNASDWADAIRAAADSDAKIISISMGSDYAMERERAATEYARSKGKLIFASVGNGALQGNKEEHYPAAYPDVVGVSAADSEGAVGEFAQNGNLVDIASPGVDVPVWCDETFQKYCPEAGGTSQATAIASGSAALVWSAHPDWTANQVLNVLFDTAARDWEDGTLSKYLGHGLIRPSMNILKGKGDPGDPDVSPLTDEKTAGAQAASPTGSAPASPAAERDAPAAGDTVAADAADDGPGAGLIAGVALAVVVVVGGAVLLVRRRRGA